MRFKVKNVMNEILDFRKYQMFCFAYHKKSINFSLNIKLHQTTICHIPTFKII